RVGQRVGEREAAGRIALVVDARVAGVEGGVRRRADREGVRRGDEIDLDALALDGLDVADVVVRGPLDRLRARERDVGDGGGNRGCSPARGRIGAVGRVLDLLDVRAGVA